MFDSFTLLYVWILSWPNKQENRLNLIQLKMIQIINIKTYNFKKIAEESYDKPLTV